MTEDDLCIIKKCTNEAFTRNLCHGHYTQLYRDGIISRDPIQKRDGRRSHPLYSTWHAMKSRCRNPNATGYTRYGGRGIDVYAAWADDPMAFINWVEENLGPKPEGMSIDRIDNDGDYEPGNLRWATPKEQAANRRRRQVGDLAAP